jgi:hypothetical protein
MPYEIFAIPVLLCFLMGFLRGRNVLQENDDDYNH